MPSKKHFHFVTLGYHPDHYGGAYRYTTAVAECLAKQGYPVDVYCAKETEKPQTEERNGVRIHWTPKGKGNFFLNWRGNNQRVYDKIQANYQHNKTQDWYLCHAYLGQAIQKAKIPYTFAFHGPWAEEFKFENQSDSIPALSKIKNTLIYHVLKNVEITALKQSTKIFCDSQYSRNSLQTWHGNHDFHAKTLVAGGGVDLQQFQPKPNGGTLRKKHDISEEGDFIFFTARRLTPRMGLERLIQCFRKIVETHSHAHLLIAGKGPLQLKLNHLIRNCDLESNVKLLGFVPEDELPNYYSMADCTIVPSLDLEGFGLVTAESLACGTPVIGSDAGATADLLGNLNRNLVFQSQHLESMREKIMHILLGKIKLPSSQQCRAYAESELSWEEVAKKYAQTDVSSKGV